MWERVGREIVATGLVLALTLSNVPAHAQPASDEPNTDVPAGQEPDRNTRQDPSAKERSASDDDDPAPDTEEARKKEGPSVTPRASRSDTPAGEPPDESEERAAVPEKAQADDETEATLADEETDGAAGSTPPGDDAELQTSEDAGGAHGDRDTQEQEERVDQPEEAPPQDLRDEIRGKDLTGSPQPPPPEQDELPPRSAPPGTERPLPDYRNRPDEPLTAGDILIWVPRGLLYPIHLVLDYGIRRPIVWGIKEVEKHHIAERIHEALTWDDGRAALFPMAYLDWGVRPNVGLSFNWREFAPNHDIYVAGFGGPNDLWAGFFELEQRLFRDDSASINWAGSYVRRPDNLFYSINDQSGRCAALDRGCRYRSATGEAHARLAAYEQTLSGVELDLMLRHTRFSTQADIPSVTTTEADDLAAFDSGYLLLRPRLHLAWDTRARNVDFTSGTGIRLDAFGSYNSDVQGRDAMWVRAGGEAAGFYDIGAGNVFGARVYAETLQNVGSRGDDGTREPVPFHELIRLGGNERMRGFLNGRLRGQNAWTATLDYRYPILWALDAEIFTSIGNVYESFSDFELSNNFLNYGLSLRLRGDRKQTFEALIGWGSNRLSAPNFEPFDQFRLTLGINRGF